MRSSILILVIVLFGNRPGRSQEVDNQLWMDYNLSVPVTKNFSYGGDAGLRGFISNKDWNQFLIRPTATYRFNQTIALAGAVALFSTLNQNNNNIFEFRIHQDLNISWPDLSVLSLFYRLRIEERFFFFENLPNDFNLRARYLIGAESQDFKLGEGKRPFYFQTILEGFKTLGDESASELFINQTRMHIAFGHRITGNLRYELHYIVQRSRKLTDAGIETIQKIFRIRLYHRIAK